MKRENQTLPSGKSIMRSFDEGGQLISELHSYENLAIACSMEFSNGKKTEESYFVKKRMVGRPRYEKARLEFPDMPPADQILADVGAELAKLARKESRQRSKAAKSRRANPLSEEQKQEAARQIPLFQAAGEGDVETLRQLLNAGEDPNCVAIEFGNTPLYNACVADSIAAVRLLLERGADPNKRFEYHSPIDGRVERNLTALMLARSVEVANALLEHGAQVDVHDGNGITPLMRAANRGKPEIVRWLLLAGATAQSADGRTALAIAEDRMKFFLEQGAGFKEGHAEKRIEQFKEICRLVSAAKA